MITNPKIQEAIYLLQKYEPSSGYHLSFSGGKDSIVLLKMAQLAQVKFTAYFYVTTLDHPDILKFIRIFYPNVIWLHPKLSFFQLIEKKGLPIRTSRYCCNHLKECYGSNSTVCDGIRKQESLSRSARSIYEVSKYDASKFFLHPIFNFDSNLIWRIIYYYKLPYPEIYSSCHTRVGCIGCCMAPRKMKSELELNPKFKKAIIKAITKRFNTGKFQNFSDPLDVYNWWVSGVSMKKYFLDKKQTSLIF